VTGCLCATSSVRLHRWSAGASRHAAKHERCGMEHLDRTQEVGASSPPSSISRTRAVEPRMAPRAPRGLSAKQPGVKQQSSILLERSRQRPKLAPAYYLLTVADNARSSSGAGVWGSTMAGARFGWAKRQRRHSGGLDPVRPGFTRSPLDWWPGGRRLCVHVSEASRGGWYEVLRRRHARSDAPYT
jgi:hypothetical protein